MQLKTILNYVERHKSFVYQQPRWADPLTKTAIEIPIEARANGRAICSGCGQVAPGYDRQPPTKPFEQPYTTTLQPSPSQNLPIDSGKEARI